MPINVNRPLKVLKNASNEDSLYSAAIELIFDEGYDNIDMLKKSRMDDELKELFTGCIYLQKKHYERAKSYFVTLSTGKYKFISNLMLADCIYDSSPVNATQNAFPYYQNAFDSTSDTLNKSLVKHRINFIRYNEK